MFIPSAIKRAASLTNLMATATTPEREPERKKHLRRSSSRRVFSTRDDAAQWAEFIWLKVVAVTRDVTDSHNMSSIKENQWQIALNNYHISIEPGLSRQIFRGLCSQGDQKYLSRSDFKAFVKFLVGNKSSFKSRVEMPSNVVALIDDEDVLHGVLIAKIINALMRASPLDVFDLLKAKFAITDSMTVSDLLNKMDEVEWHNRIKIMEHIATSDAIAFNRGDAQLALQKWAIQFGDERSQLVRVALETCPIVLSRILEAGIMVDATPLLQALALPIRAKRSKELQKWGHACGENIICVFLNHYREIDDGRSTSESSVASSEDLIMSTDLIDIVNALCDLIAENGKFEIVREKFVSYIVQIFVFYKESFEVTQFFENEECCGKIVGMLDMCLLDKKCCVRDQACRFMRLLEKINQIAQHVEVKAAIEGNVLSQIDVQARVRFERRKTKRNGRVRPRIRPALSTLVVSQNEKPQRIRQQTV